MADKLIRGTLKGQEVRDDLPVRDTRAAVTKAVDWLKVRNNLATLLIMFAALAFLVPAVADLSLIIAGLLTWFGLTRIETAPLKLPAQAKMLDEHERNPGNGEPMKANGIFFLGNELRTGKEVWLTNSDCRQHFLVLGTTGAGKALPVDAKVHTPTGWKAMGDLQVGDLVSTPDGGTAPITGFFPQGEVDVLRLTFCDGRTAEACPDHLWEVHHKHWNGKYKKGQSRAGCAEPRLLRTKDIVDLLATNKGSISVRLPAAVQKPASKTILHPYLLGALIGDGNFSGLKVIRFSTADEFIKEKVGILLAALGYELHSDPTAADCDFCIRQKVASPGKLSLIREQLRELGLDCLLSHEKFIPQAYIDGSIEQRWQLIQGLMDTDGSADSRHGSLTFSTSSPALARDFGDLVRSLGGIATQGVKKPFYKDSDGQRREGKTSYVISIRHPEPRNFFTLPRKYALVDKDYQYSDLLKLRIEKIEYVRRAEAACILVDHPDHLFITDNYVVTHNTEALLGFAANAIAWGSGFLFCDGKGDVALFAKVYALARRFGREDDLLVLNYMTGNQDLGSSNGKLRSNTLNPFATGSSDTLTQMVVGLMDDAGGDGAMWKGRATAMFTGVMRALAWLRDQQIVDLNVSEIRDHLNLKRIIDLGDQTKYPDLPQAIRKSIKSYLTSLPGFQEDKGHKQSQTTLDQHGYLEMQFTKILGSLADVYGHIFHTPYGEIDMTDVVLNRRILVIMLPALEKSNDEIANLGKIVVATLKGMMGSTLGSQIEGSWDAVVENRPTNSPSPFIVVLDEVGYYMVDGMDLMSAQARSLGFSLIFAGQDINAMKRLNEKVFGSVQGNTNTKIIMRTEDPETAKLAVEAGGKALRAQAQTYQGQTKEVGGRSYADNMEARLEAVDRVNPLDLKAQDEGEMHIIHKEWLVRAKSFYANPEGAVNRKNLKLRANHFITVAKPDAEEIESQQRLPEIVQRLADPDFGKQMKTDAANAAKHVVDTAEIGSIVSTLAIVAEGKRRPSSPVEAACVVFAKISSANKEINESYAAEVRGASGGRPMMPEDIDDFSDQNPRGRPDRQRRPDAPFDGFADPDPRMADPRRNRPLHAMPEEFEDPERVSRSKAPVPAAKPFNAGRVKKDVDHGVRIDGGEVHQMADRLTSNEGIVRTLAKLNFNEDEETAESVDSAIEEALLIGDEDGDPVDSGPFDDGEIEKTSGAANAALPDFDDEFDDEDQGGNNGGTVDQFLHSLLGEDDD